MNAAVFPALFAALFLAAGLHSFSQAAPWAVLWGLWSSALLLGVAVPAAAAGRAALFKLRGASPGERTFLGAALGLAGLSYGALALAAPGLLSLGPVIGLVALLAVLGHGHYRALWESLRDELRDVPTGWGLAAAALLGAAWLAAWAPPHQYDSLVYHLPLADGYARTGRLAASPDLLYSHFPQNGEMLFALGLVLGSDVTAQLFGVLATALSALAVWLLCARGQAPRAAGALAVVLYLSHTAVLLLASTTYVEPLVGLWLVAAVYAFHRWWDAPLELASARGWLALSGLFCGVAFGTKYYAGLAPGILALFALLRTAREPRLSASSLALFAGAAVVPAAPWLLKNWLRVGDPVFPFLYDRFALHDVAWTAESARRYFHVLTEYGHASLWGDLLRFPVVLFTRATRFGGGMDVLGDLGWTLPFAAAPLFVVAARRSPWARFLAAYLVCHFLAWFATGVVLRFFTVVAALFACLAGVSLHGLWTERPRLRPALAAALAAFLAGRLLLFAYVHAVFETPSVVLGLESRDEFLSRKLAYYPCARRATEVLGKNDRILLVGEQRSYYLRAERFATSVFQTNLFDTEARAAASPDDLARRLRGLGFTWLLWVPGEAERLKGYGVLDLGPKQPVWDGFIKSLPVAYAAPGCALLRLAP